MRDWRARCRYQLSVVEYSQSQRELHKTAANGCIAGLSRYHMELEQAAGAKATGAAPRFIVESPNSENRKLAEWTQV